MLAHSQATRRPLGGADNSLRLDSELLLETSLSTVTCGAGFLPPHPLPPFKSFWRQSASDACRRDEQLVQAVRLESESSAIWTIGGTLSRSRVVSTPVVNLLDSG